MTDPTLFEWAGGADAFRRLIDAFYDRTENDELISPLFPGGVSEDHRAHVTTWWIGCSVDPAATPMTSADMSGCSITTATSGSRLGNDSGSPR
jgi:truncated hemoglobin YjbI